MGKVYPCIHAYAFNKSRTKLSLRSAPNDVEFSVDKECCHQPSAHQPSQRGNLTVTFGTVSILLHSFLIVSINQFRK